jgi:hypothetical protein
VIDGEYELPVAFRVTRASVPEIPEGKKLMEELAEKHGEILDRCEYWLGDRRYDDTDTIEILWDEYRVKPIIDITK